MYLCLVTQCRSGTRRYSVAKGGRGVGVINPVRAHRNDTVLAQRARNAATIGLNSKESGKSCCGSRAAPNWDETAFIPSYCTYSLASAIGARGLVCATPSVCFRPAPVFTQPIIPFIRIVGLVRGVKNLEGRCMAVAVAVVLVVVVVQAAALGTFSGAGSPFVTP
jgi:hypothetical protein